MKKFIKTLNKETALASAERGFSYLPEKINKNQEIYVFVMTDELIKLINENFALNDFFEDDVLRFGGAYGC